MGTRESQSSRVRRAMRPRGLVKTVVKLRQGSGKERQGKARDGER